MYAGVQKRGHNVISSFFFRPRFVFRCPPPHSVCERVFHCRLLSPPDLDRLLSVLRTALAAFPELGEDASRDLLLPPEFRGFDARGVRKLVAVLLTVKREAELGIHEEREVERARRAARKARRSASTATQAKGCAET